MEDIKVLIVDDSALMRSLIGKIVDGTHGLTVADKAMNGRFALQKLERVQPDIIVLDLEMPEMNGIEFLRERKRLNIDIPVIILSSIAKEGARITMDCLELGASDFVTKPSGSESANLATVASQLVEFLQAYGRQYQLKKQATSGIKTSPATLAPHYIHTPHLQTAPQTHTAVSGTSVFAVSPEEAEKPMQVRQPGKLEIIAIGISTGGPNALREVFAELDPNLPQPIVVVQHMPPGFTYEFANSLNKICPLEVKEAQEGDLVKPGRILIAQGGKHLMVEKKPLGVIAHISDAPPQSGHRPSADVLFASVAEQFQNRALGIIMTGMGKDGAASLTRLYQEGSRTIGQDEASAIVYGMPRVAYEMGGVMEQVSLSNMASVINRYGREFA
ncbi:chemotaxis response regulator protein-glutamate methylesterase [Treponema sp. OMZ 305]|uniref:protein-glutamate methylesterase/protein-glutamine glutaminase n=1 Tax=Treponema sp. OMZ 305 TaxID=1659192 RepID=UPI0020A5A200|nr:chemotaxis response regulator protein-glutamate methylesterase [Treponema sp. OMZ 305]UTC58575.1 chemotaxis response regulator protein-glutamate methylesterase [Treponema sp. OMZ 305]